MLGVGEQDKTAHAVKNGPEQVSRFVDNFGGGGAVLRAAGLVQGVNVDPNVEQKDGPGARNVNRCSSEGALRVYADTCPKLGCGKGDVAPMTGDMAEADLCRCMTLVPRNGRNKGHDCGENFWRKTVDCEEAATGRRRNIIAIVVVVKDDGVQGHIKRMVQEVHQ